MEYVSTPYAAQIKQSCAEPAHESSPQSPQTLYSKPSATCDLIECARARQKTLNTHVKASEPIARNA